MNCILNKLNTTKKLTFNIPSVIKFYTLCLFIAALITGDVANSHAQNIIPVDGCPGEVFEFNIGFQTENGAVCEPVGQFIGVDLITAEPVVSNFNLSNDCTLSFTFNGEGNFTFSLENPDFNTVAESLRFNLTYKQNCEPTISCPEGNPLQWDWVQDIINQNSGSSECDVNSIQQFENNGNTMIITTIELPCPSDNRYVYYNCEGEKICVTGGTPRGMWCGGDITTAANNATTIWNYEDNPPTLTCPGGDPVQWNWVQDLITQSSEGIGCGVNSIQQFQYSGSTFIKTTPGGYVNDIACPADIPVILYNCEGSIVCKTRALAVTPPEDLCDADINTAAYNGTTIWRYDESPPTQSCPEGDPLQWDWIQTLINATDGCFVAGIQKFEYNGNTFFKTTRGGIVNGVSCLDDIPEHYYDCNGNFICETGGITPFEEWCESEIIAVANSATTIWRYDDSPPTESCPEGDPLQWQWMQNLITSSDGCYFDEIRQFEYQGNTYYRTAHEGSPCLTENSYNYYNCQGEEVCQTIDLAAPGFPYTPCDQDIISASFNSYTSIWVFADTAPSLFLDYGWLGSWVNPNNCSGESITVYDAGSYNFVLIQNGNEGKLYFENGSYYCDETPTYSCVAAYGLTNVVQTWACGNNTSVSGCTDTNATNYNPNANIDDGSCQYETINDPVFTTYPWLSTYVNQSNCLGTNITVYDAGSYNFILIQNGNESKLYFENGTYYCDETPSYSCVAAYNLNNVAQTWACGFIPPNPEPGCTDANAINYNPSATVDDGSCQYENTGTCNTYTGTFFYQDCGGINYYFIRLADGRVFDPYFAEGIGITPREGQQINFDYVIKTDVTTPCTISESPITITCFEEVNNTVFENYPWLSTYVNSNNCNGESIIVYNAGSYNFVLIQNGNEGKLYFENGTYYCDETPTYSCVAAYGLSNVMNSWSCGGLQNQKLSQSFVNSYVKKMSFNIYPNPTSNKVFIDLPDQSYYQINLLDISGKVLKQTNTETNATAIELNVNDLPKGMYLVELRNELNSHIQKLIIE